MAVRKKPHATGKVKAGDVTERVGVEQVEARGVDVPPRYVVNTRAGAFSPDGISISSPDSAE